MTKLIYGTDPEMFALDNRDSVIPPVLLRKDLGIYARPDPEHPEHPVFLSMNGGYIHEDGAAFEFCITPSPDWEELFDKIQYLKSEFERRVLSNASMWCDGKLHPRPTAKWDVDRWKHRGPSFAYATRFGCDKDYDASKEDDDDEGEPEEDASMHPFRYSGGHAHFSGSEAIIKYPKLAIHSLMLTSGLAAIAGTDVPDQERTRTYRYGRPERYRVQTYSGLFNNIPNTHIGIEYRTPSSRWTKSKEHARSVFEWGTRGILEILETGRTDEFMSIFGEHARKAILSSDKETALQILNEMENML